MPATPRAAAVLVPIIDRPGAPTLLLTMRAGHLRQHAGQISFPGGRIEASDDDVLGAALRETREEIGVDPAFVEPLGFLPDQVVLTGFRITPVVAWGGDNPSLDPDPVEVATVFHIPLTELDSPSIPRLTPTAEGKPPVMSAPLPSAGGQVYAPTAALLYQFREVALHGRPTRVAHFDQPKFAWK